MSGELVFGGTSLCGHGHLAVACSVSGQCRIEKLERELADMKAERDALVDAEGLSALSAVQAAKDHVRRNRDNWKSRAEKSEAALADCTENRAMERADAAENLRRVEAERDAARAALREACEQWDARLLPPEWSQEWRKAAGLETP